VGLSRVPKHIHPVIAGFVELAYSPTNHSARCNTGSARYMPLSRNLSSTGRATGRRPACLAASTSQTVPRNASPSASAQRRPAKSSITAVLSAKVRASRMTALSPGPRSHACTSAESRGTGRTSSQSSVASARAVWSRGP